VIRSRGTKAFKLLLEAHDYAELLSRDRWDFALDIRELSRGGLSANDIRWLLYRRLVEHGTETTVPGADLRTFRPAGALGFERASCFLLTQAGIDFVRKGEVSHFDTLPMPSREASDQPKPEELIPTWYCDRQELRLGNKIVKRFATPAPNQQLILATFPEDRWPVRIDDPLPPQGEQDPKRRLHDTINSLNRHQKEGFVRFFGDGSGEGVRWELVMANEIAKRSNGYHVSENGHEAELFLAKGA
jgi:hypothetical protein